MTMHPIAVQTSPVAASEFARGVDALYAYLIGVSVVFTVGICATLVFFVIRYRRQSDADRPAPTKDGKLLEILGSVIPFVLIMIMFFWGAKLYFDARVPPANAMEILVTGKQWMWKMQHPNGKRELNDLHVPVGIPIKLTMTSEDVIHSFLLPQFRKKMDVLPGKYTQMWFMPEEEGRFHIFCAEYCGTEHSLMVGTLYVVSQSEYEEFLTRGGVGGTVATAASENPVDAGKALWELHCMAACHTGRPGAIGPNIQHAFGTMRELEDGTSVLMDENYVRNSMINPNDDIAKGYPAAMTSFRGVLTNTQMNHIIAYLKSVAEADVE